MLCCGAEHRMLDLELAPGKPQAAAKEMKHAFKHNKELDITRIEGLQDDMMDLMVSQA